MASVSEMVTLSAYIVSFASAAMTANQILSTGNDAMSIKEFRFKIALHTENSIASTTEVTFKSFIFSGSEKLEMSSSSSTDFEIECTIAPTWSIEGK